MKCAFKFIKVVGEGNETGRQQCALKDENIFVRALAHKFCIVPG